MTILMLQKNPLFNVQILEIVMDSEKIATQSRVARDRIEEEKVSGKTKYINYTT